MMKNQPNIHLIGLGAIGCAFAAQALDNGTPLSIICDEDRKQRYSTQPFIINNKPYSFNYITEKEPAQLLLISVKFNQLENAIQQAQQFINNDTIIISLLNGINSEAIIEQQLKTNKLVHAYVIGTDSKKYGRQVEFTQNGKIVVGTPHKDREVLLQKALAILQASALPAEESTDILRDMWWKFMVNIGINQIAALFQAPYGRFKEKNIQAMTVMAMKEVITIANAQNISLVEADILPIFKLLETWGKTGKASMLQDIENKREKEVEMLSGELCRLGQLHQIPTPVNQFLLHAIRYVEREK